MSCLLVGKIAGGAVHGIVLWYGSPGLSVAVF